MQVAIIMGSASDKEIMGRGAAVLKEFGIPYRSFILSAHRVPEQLEKTLEELEDQGTGCIIAGAGLAAHLPGVIASKTIIPVIGVPLNAALSGLDALFSIVQMPKQIPVATVGIGNAANAAYLAAQILALSDGALKQKVKDFRADMKKTFLEETGGEIEL